MTIYEVLNQISNNGQSFDYRRLRSIISTDIYDQIDDKRLFQLIDNIMSMYIEYRDKNASFKPYLIWNDGSKSFSTEDISDKDIARLETLEVLKLPLKVRAQICDVLWNIKGDYRQAQIAADAYFDLFDEVYDPENWVDCVNMISRAVILAAKLNDANRLKRYMTYIYDSVLLLDGTDKLFFSTQIISLLLSQKYKCDYSTLIPISDNLIAGNKDNYNRLRDAYHIKANLYKRLGREHDANKTMISYAQELISLADGERQTVNDIFIAEMYYQQAILLLQDYGQDTKEANKKLLCVQKQIAKELKPHKFEIDNSDIVQLIYDRYSVGYKDCLKLLAIDVPWMEVNKIKQEVVNLVKEHPLQNLFPKKNINRDGNIITIIPVINNLDPNENQDVLLANMYSKARENEEVYTNITLNQVLEIIREKKEFNEQSLDYIVNDNILIPEGREEIVKTGLYLGINGKYYEALHILAPQVENLFRELAKTCGDVVINFRDGIQQAKTLGSIFDCDNLKLCYDENILFTFRGLMEKKEGSNIRNLIGHGLMEREDVGYSCIYFICAVFKLLFYNSKNVLKEFSNTRKDSKT